VIAALRGESRVLLRIDAMAEDQGVLCAPVLAELVHGAMNSQKPEANLGAVQAIASRMRFEPFGREAAERWGRLKATFRKAGLPRADFDFAIAAIALELGAVLVSHDKAHLDGIPDLVVEDWLSD
jgi:tRNA(fMet)-specific endonuclease VapC